ncbi:phosphotransferase [Cytobacillus sp. Hz8]|uniref:phosphotransferase n=1 Tax=Cytobacillus sp. Hz8 TaxID=3347168 RepID=UPI0035DE94F1
MHLLRKSLNIVLKQGFKALFIHMNIWLKRKKFIQYLVQKEWTQASVLGEKLVNLIPERIENYLYLALCYKNLRKNELATSTLFQGLRYITNPEILIKVIEDKFPAMEVIQSKYIYMGGEQNLGCFEHTLTNNGEIRKYLTKITTQSSIELERAFYLKIYKHFKNVRFITPKIINISERKTENLALLTMEKVDGIVPNLNGKILKEAINASKLINTVYYCEIIDLIPQPDFNKEFQLINKNYPNHPIFALYSFISIHKKQTNQRLFQLIYKRMRELKYTAKTYELIKKLEMLVFDWELYNQINPIVDYTLQHGDFDSHNMIWNVQMEKLYIIDWGNMYVGPKWIDLAGLFGQLKLPFHEIDKLFLNIEDETTKINPIEKIFFLYPLIVTWIIVFTRNELEENLDYYLRPAIEEFESLTLKVNNVRFVLHG